MSYQRYAWSSILAGGHPLAVGYTYRIVSPSLVVFLHGLGCSRLSFNEAWTRAELAGYSLLALDFSGHGFTGPPETVEPIMGIQAEILDNLLDFFLQMWPHEHIHLVGHSMGGAVPLLMDEAGLARISSFSNLEGNLVREDCGLLSRPVANMNEAAFKKTLPTAFLAPLEEVTRYLSLGLVKPKTFYQMARSLVKTSELGILPDSWRRLSLPKRYFYGSLSEPPGLKQVAEADRLMVPGAGHFMMNEAPDTFYPLLADFIKSTT